MDFFDTAKTYGPWTNKVMVGEGIVTLRGSERHLFSRSENSHAAAGASHQVFMAEARSVRCVRAEVRLR